LILLSSGISVDIWMTMLNMRHVLANKYNVILMFLSLKQNITIFPLKIKSLIDVSMHRLICIRHVNNSHFVKVFSSVYLLNYLQIILYDKN